jgi:hypothetical protein
MYKVKTRTYECKICNNKYASSGSLWCHNKKFHRYNTEQVQNDINQQVQSDNFVSEQVQNDTLNINISDNFTTEQVQYNIDTNENDLEQNSHNIVITENDNNQPFNKSLTCEHCNKKFNCRSSKSMHKKTCKSNINILDEYNKLKEENEKLKNTLVNVPNTSTINTTNADAINTTNADAINTTNADAINTTNANTINTTNTNADIINTNNGTMNSHNKINNGTINNVVVNHIGSEKIDLNPKQIKSIVSRGLNGAVNCIKKVNFNKKKPENHSFCSSSLAAPYCKAINYKTQKPEIVAKKDVVDMVLESSFRMLEGISIQIECNDELKNEFTKKELKKLENLIASKPKFYESKNKKSFYKSINMLSYNYKNLIMSTWELLKPIEEDNTNNNNNDDDSDTDWSNLKDMSDFGDSSDEKDNYNSSDDSDDENVLKI